jgi:hypothetical protein
LQELEEAHCQGLLVYSTGLAFGPSILTGIDLRFMDIVETVDDIENWNLTDLIVKLLVKGIRQVKENKISRLVDLQFC